MAMVPIGCVFFLTPSLAYLLIPELGLTPMQLMLIFTAPIAMGVFTNMPGGALGDRYGIRLTVGTGALLAGLSTVARFWVSSFGEMLLLACVFGIGVGIAFPNLSKLVATWFPPKQSGLASGIYVTAFPLGSGIGLAAGPYFGGWQTAFLYVGILSTALAFLWILLSRSVPKGIKIKMPPPINAIKVAIKSKNIWLLGLSLLLFNGGFTGISGNLPSALSSICNISPQEAGVISSLLTFAGIPGSLLLPLISDRFGLRKPFIYAGAIVPALCFYLAWLFAPGIDTYILIVMAGFISAAVFPMFMTMPMEWVEIGREYAGGATGLVAAVGSVGGSLIPLLVITPLMAAQTAAAYNTGFLATVLLIAAIAVTAIPLTESGTRASAGAKGKSTHNAQKDKG
jgi:NNP family nitrate/nitrite transporter-like MFS transporter